MSRNKSLFLLVVIVLSAFVTGCGQDKVTEVTNNSDGLVAIANSVSDEVETPSCGLQYLGQYMGDSSKASFLVGIHDKCVEMDEKGDWDVAFEDVTGMSYEDYVE